MMDIKARLFVILVSMTLLFLVINSVRRKNLREEYAFLWLVTGVLLVLVPIFSDYVDRLAHFIGIHYEPALVFVIAIICLLLMLFHFSIVISKLTEQNKVLTQDLALLQKEIEDLKERIVK